MSGCLHRTIFCLSSLSLLFFSFTEEGSEKISAEVKTECYFSQSLSKLSYLPIPRLKDCIETSKANNLIHTVPSLGYVLLLFSYHYFWNYFRVRTQVPLIHYWKWKWSHSVVSNSLRPYGPRLLRPQNFLGTRTRVGCHFLLQGIFLTQGLNPGLLHCRQMLYCLSYQGSP